MAYPFAQPEQTVLVLAGPSSVDSYTLSSADSVVRVDATYKPMTIIVPLASSMKGYSFDIKRLNTNSNAVTLQCSGTDTLEGASSKVIANPLDNIRIHSNGLTWDIKTSNVTLARSTFAPVSTPSLVLDFVNKPSIDSRLTFMRSSTATRYDSKSLVQDVALNEPRLDHDPLTGSRKGLLIERYSTNFVPFAEYYSMSYWNYDNISVSLAQTTAPDGSLAGGLILENATNSTKGLVLRNTMVGALGGGTYTLSIYAKIYDLTNPRLLWMNLAASGDVSHNAVFDLVNGTVTYTSSGTTTSLVKCSGGWYRCSITAAKINTPTSTFGMTMSTDGSTSYQGTGSGGIFLWGAQLESNTFASSYVRPTYSITSRPSQAYYYDASGILKLAAEGVLRNSYNPDNLAASPRPIFEANGTNRILWSEDFNASDWGKTGVNIDILGDGTLAPDALSSVQKLTASSPNSFVRQPIPVNPSTRYSFSVWLRSTTPTNVRIYLYEEAGEEAYTTCTVNTRWKRFTVSKITSASANTLYGQIGGGSSFTTGAAVMAWGAQLEMGGASSYIKTTSASATRPGEFGTTTVGTRANDVCFTELGPWYNRTEGTLAVEAVTYSKAGYPAAATLDVGGTPDNRLSLFLDPNLKQMAGFYRNDGLVNQSSSTTGAGTMDTGKTYILAMSFKSSYFRMSGGDNLAPLDTGLRLSTNLTRLTLGDGDVQLNGHLLKLKYYPAIVNADELKGLSQ